MKHDSGYNTKHREKLLGFLEATGGKHVTVQEISAYLTNEGTPMGTATIYRQLDRLVEKGIVRKYILDGKSGACYQYIGIEEACHEHFHLKCVSCSRLIHVTCDFLSDISRHVSEEHGFSVDSSQTVFYGICSQCRGVNAE